MCVGVFEFGEERDGIRGVGRFRVLRFKTVEGHEGDTTSLFGEHDVEDALGGGVSIDYDVEKTMTDDSLIRSGREGNEERKPTCYRR